MRVVLRGDDKFFAILGHVELRLVFAEILPVWLSQWSHGVSANAGSVSGIHGGVNVVFGSFHDRIHSWILSRLRLIGAHSLVCAVFIVCVAHSFMVTDLLWSHFMFHGTG
jgi:hypothetical protein